MPGLTCLLYKLHVNGSGPTGKIDFVLARINEFIDSSCVNIKHLNQKVQSVIAVEMKVESDITHIDSLKDLVYCLHASCGAKPYSVVMLYVGMKYAPPM